MRQEHEPLLHYVAKKGVTHNGAQSQILDRLYKWKNDFHLHHADGSHSEIFNRPWDSGIKPRTFCISGENIGAVYPPKMVFQQTLLI